MTRSPGPAAQAGRRCIAYRGIDVRVRAGPLPEGLTPATDRGGTAAADAVDGRSATPTRTFAPERRSARRGCRVRRIDHRVEVRAGHVDEAGVVSRASVAVSTRSAAFAQRPAEGGVDDVVRRQAVVHPERQGADGDLDDVDVAATTWSVRALTLEHAAATRSVDTVGDDRGTSRRSCADTDAELGMCLGSGITTSSQRGKRAPGEPQIRRHLRGRVPLDTWTRSRLPQHVVVALAPDPDRRTRTGMPTSCSTLESRTSPSRQAARLLDVAEAGTQPGSVPVHPGSTSPSTSDRSGYAVSEGGHRTVVGADLDVGEAVEHVELREAPARSGCCRAARHGAKASRKVEPFGAPARR